jgi:hypothetical protein
MSNKWAYTNLESGECVHVMETSLNYNYQISEGDSDGVGNLIHSLNDVSDWRDYPENKYWDNGWKDKPARPSGGYYNWTLQGWIFDSERLLSDLRRKRNELLDSSDWTRMDDNELDDDTREIWATYRQELRDITNNLDDITNLEDVPWPTKPE